MVRKLLWVNRIAFDLSLDRTTWMGMADALKELGVDVTLIGLSQQEHKPEGEFKQVIWIRPDGTGVIGFVSFLFLVWFHTLKWALREKPDWIIVDVSTFFCAFPLDILGRLGLIRTKVILDIRTFHSETGVQSKLRDRVWAFYDHLSLIYGRYFHSGLSVIVPAMAEEARRRGGHPHMCIWTSGYHKRQNGSNAPVENSTLDQVAALSRENFLLMYHGVLSGNRGLKEAVEGTALARSRGYPVFLALVGYGEEAEPLQKLIDERGYQSACRIFPAVPHELIYLLIKNACLGVMTYPPLDYFTYNMPLKLVEYLSMGKPVLCTDLPMFRNAVTNLRCLAMMPNNQPETIARKIREMVDCKEELQSMGEVAFQAAEELTWEKQAERFDTFLESL